MRSSSLRHPWRRCLVGEALHQTGESPAISTGHCDQWRLQDLHAYDVLHYWRPHKNNRGFAGVGVLYGVKSLGRFGFSEPEPFYLLMHGRLGSWSMARSLTIIYGYIRLHTIVDVCIFIFMCTYMYPLKFASQKLSIV